MKHGEADLGESKPLPPPTLQITEHPPDWGTLGDPAETTLERCRRLGDRLLAGAWFLNPIRTIHSPTDTPRFHQAAAEAQARWRRTLTDNLNCGHKGFRRAVRKVVREAKKEALGEIVTPTSRTNSFNPRSDALPDRQLVRNFVRYKKLLAVSGLMLVDGHVIEPRNRGRPETDKDIKIQEVSVTRRRCDFSPLMSDDNLQPLMITSRNELRLHLAANPNAALYVTPGITVVGQSFNPSFLKKARKAESWWHDLTHTEIGKPRLRKLAKSAGEAAGMLFFHGTLVANGRFYRPGRWPNPAEDLNHLDQGSPDDPTVSGETLGLT